MERIQFEWDPDKNLKNTRKHGVSFDEAQTVFFDNVARLIADPDHSENEERFILLGLSSHLRILVISHCYRESDNIIRIISARKATSNEAAQYLQGRFYA